MNLENSDIRTQTLPPQDSAPALKQILRKDAACSHLCVKCVCIVCVCSVFARLCVKFVCPYVCETLRSVNVCGGVGGPSCQCTWQQLCIRPLVCARLCVKCVCPYVCGGVCAQTCMCMLVAASLRAVVCEQCVGSCVKCVCFVCVCSVLAR